MRRIVHHVILRQIAFPRPRPRYSIRYPIPFLRHEPHQRRCFLHIPTVLVPPLIFSGLFIALWTWKCFMMVLFQNKIIYMPGLPPNARLETIADYKNQCGGIQWREERTVADDRTRISLCVASVDSGPPSQVPKKEVYLLYFQGHHFPSSSSDDL